MQRPEGFWQEDVHSCRRCGAERQGPYCSQCGQKKERRLTVRGTLGEVAHHLTSFDSVLLRTVVDLSRHPGVVARRYIAGNRTGYFNPAKYVFLAATLYAFVVLYFEVDVRPQGARYDDPRAVAGMRLVVSVVGYLVFVYLLPAAAVLQRLFRRYPLTFAESYVALLFFAGQYIGVLTLLALAGIYSIPGGFWLARGLGFLILLWTLAGLYRSSPLRTVLAGAVVYVVMLVGMILSGMIVVLLSWALRS